MKTQISQNSGVGAFNFSSGEHLTSKTKLETSKSQASPPARNRPSGQFFDLARKGQISPRQKGVRKVAIQNWNDHPLDRFRGVQKRSRAPGSFFRDFWVFLGFVEN